MLGTCILKRIVCIPIINLAGGRDAGMVDLILSVGGKVLVLFLMIATGAVTARKRILTREGASQLAELVLLIATPCVIISAFSADMGEISIPNLLFMAAAAVTVHILGIGVSHLLFRGQETARRKVLQFSAVYANVGFMGLPLLQSLLGNDGVIYASVFIAVFNIFCWTHGVRLMDRSEDSEAAPPIWKCLLNPGTVGLAIGLPVFLFQIPLPSLLGEVINGFAGLNTPLAMICIGVHISAISPKAALRDRSMLGTVAVRLLVLPLAVFGLLCLTTRDYTAFSAILLQSAMPAAANAVLFASRYHGDEQLASQTVAVSTLLSILTLPLFAAAARAVCG